MVVFIGLGFSWWFIKRPKQYWYGDAENMVCLLELYPFLMSNIILYYEYDPHHTLNI